MSMLLVANHPYTGIELRANVHASKFGYRLDGKLTPAGKRRAVRVVKLFPSVSAIVDYVLCDLKCGQIIFNSFQ